MVSSFFVNKKLDPVIIKGRVLLAFAGPILARNRKLLKDTEALQSNAKTLLDYGSAMMKLDTTDANAKSNILNLVAIITACGAIITFAIDMHL